MVTTRWLGRSVAHFPRKTSARRLLDRGSWTADGIPSDGVTTCRPSTLRTYPEPGERPRLPNKQPLPLGACAPAGLSARDR